MSIFDEIIAGRVPASIVYRDQSYIAFMDIRPMGRGHTLVCPLRAVATLAELDQDERTGLWDLANRIALAQQQALGSLAQHFLVNDGKAASQSVPHVHIHVIPRFGADAIATTTRMLAHVGLRFLPMPVSRGKRERLDQQAQAIANAMTGLV